MTASTEEHLAVRRRDVVLSVVLGRACVAAPVLVGNLTPRRAPLFFVTTTILLLIVLGHVVWRARGWTRPRRRAGRLDYVLAVVPLLTGAVALFLVLGVAGAYGIQGSALARVQHGHPGDLAYCMPVDPAYLAVAA